MAPSWSRITGDNLPVERAAGDLRPGVYHVTPVSIRPAAPGDGPTLQEIERLAGARFAEVGLPEVAADEPPSLDVLDGYGRAGRAWVAVDAGQRIVGYVLVDQVDGNAHIEQVSVVPDHQGLGVGRALVDHVRGWAAERRLPAVTLTTFTEVPWNAPLYAHLGFRSLADDELGSELRAVRDAETAHGLDPGKRVCMRLELSG
jgi:GNAT superfamily N-acetyltransferase